MSSDKLIYGIDKEIQERINAKWNQADADVALKWVSDLSGMELTSNFHESLKDGIALCKAMNKLSPNSCKINNMKMPFMIRENICAFIEGAKKYGLKDVDAFVSQDLYEGENLVEVLNCIFSLGGIAKSKGFAGPTIGVKPSQKQETSKFEIKSTGSAVLSRQTQGSHGYTDTSIDTVAGHQIIQSNAAASSEPTKFSKGSESHYTGADFNDKIFLINDERLAQTGAMKK